MTLTSEQRGELEAVMRKRNGNAALARRARCALLWADGERRVDIRAKLACNDEFVLRWTNAYEAQATTAADPQLLTLIAQCKVGHRPGRIEARMRKRRPKPYPWLKVPRAEARRCVERYGHAKKPK